MHDFIKTPPAIATKTSVSFAEFKQHQADALKDPHKFWAKMARDHLDWIKDFTVTQSGSFKDDARDRKSVV